MRPLQNTLLVCPTYNPGEEFVEWLEAYDSQAEKPAKSIIIDSSSTDGYVSRACEYGFEIKTIKKESFDHGGTRQSALDYADEFAYVIYLTQDAVLASKNSLSDLLQAFNDQSVGAVCGRQLPRRNAGSIEEHARVFNYPDGSGVKSLSDTHVSGLKTAFLSNSFAAYRISTLREAGGFPDHIIFGEDMYVAARLLMAGFKISYNSDACVYHSHAYSLKQEFQRYFDMGVFHSQEPWLRKRLGRAEKEGARFVVSEFKYLAKHAYWRIPEGILRTVLRYLGFRFGLFEKYLPLSVKQYVCMNKGYFNRS